MDVVVTYNSNKAEGEAVVDAIRDAGGRAAALPFDLLAIRNNPGFQAMLVAQTAMGRPAEPQDIGGLVRLLCSDDARWLTGQRLEATGGYNL